MLKKLSPIKYFSSWFLLDNGKLSFVLKRQSVSDQSCNNTQGTANLFGLEKGSENEQRRTSWWLMLEQQNNCLNRKEEKEQEDVSKDKCTVDWDRCLPLPTSFSLCIFQLVGHRRRVIDVISLRQQVSYFCLVAFSKGDVPRRCLIIHVGTPQQTC